MYYTVVKQSGNMRALNEIIRETLVSDLCFLKFSVFNSLFCGSLKGLGFLIGESKEVSRCG